MVDRAVLDTSVLLAPTLDRLPGELAISVVSLAELHFGVLATTDANRRAQRLRRLTGLTRRFDPLPVDEAVAEQYGELAAQVVHLGRQPRARVMGLLIAATARAHDAVLYTRNPDDLRGLEDLITVVPV